MTRPPTPYAALSLLVRLQGRAAVRRVLRGIGTGKGAMLSALSVVVLILWIGPSIFVANSEAAHPQAVRDLGPLAMLGVVLLVVITSGTDAAITFSGAETDLLFPGPFTRRQLIGYKIAKLVFGALITAVLIAVVLLRHASHYINAYLAVALAILLTNLVGVLLPMVAQSIGQRAYSRARKLILVLLVLGVALPVAPTLLQIASRPEAVMEALRNWPLVRIVTAPFVPFIEVLISEHYGVQFWRWLALAVGVDAGAILLILWLDSDFLEASIAQSQRHYDRLQRVRRGGITAVGGPSRAGFSLPMLPSLRGAGPIAWRQLVTAARSSRGMLIILALVCVMAMPVVIAGRQKPQLAGVLVGTTMWLSIFLASTLRLDFRGDLDQLEALKVLPISALAIAAGELVAPTLVMSCCHALVVIGGAIAMPAGRAMLVAAIVLVLPVNALLFAVENIAFLFFPTRGGGGAADLQNMGRQVLTTLVKIFVLILGLSVAGIPAAIVYYLTRSIAVSAAILWALVAVEAAAATYVLAWAYRRFDVSMDMPA